MHKRKKPTAATVDLGIAVVPRVKFDQEIFEHPILLILSSGPFYALVAGYFFPQYAFVELWAEEADTHVRTDLPAPFSPWFVTDDRGHFEASIAIPPRGAERNAHVMIAVARELNEADTVHSDRRQVRYDIFL